MSQGAGRVDRLRRRARRIRRKCGRTAVSDIIAVASVASTISGVGVGYAQIERDPFVGIARPLVSRSRRGPGSRSSAAFDGEVISTAIVACCGNVGAFFRAPRPGERLGFGSTAGPERSRRAPRPDLVRLDRLHCHLPGKLSLWSLSATAKNFVNSLVRDEGVASSSGAGNTTISPSMISTRIPLFGTFKTPPSSRRRPQVVGGVPVETGPRSRSVPRHVSSSHHANDHDCDRYSAYLAESGDARAMHATVRRAWLL